MRNSMLEPEEFWGEFKPKISENIKFFPFRIRSWTPFINSILFELGKELGYYTRYERRGIDVCWLSEEGDIELVFE